MNAVTGKLFMHYILSCTVFFWITLFIHLFTEICKRSLQINYCCFESFIILYIFFRYINVPSKLLPFTLNIHTALSETDINRLGSVRYLQVITPISSSVPLIILYAAILNCLFPVFLKYSKQPLHHSRENFLPGRWKSLSRCRLTSCLTCGLLCICRIILHAW